VGLRLDFGRTLVAETEGFRDFAPAIDSVAAGFAAMDGDGPLVHAEDSASRATAVVAEAGMRRAATK
jgi:hypothetical protein